MASRSTRAVHGCESMVPAHTGYAICTVGRSGSTWIAELLGSTGVLGYPSEYFSTGFQKEFIGGPAYPSDRMAQVEHVLRAGATPNGVYGLKIFPIHLDDVLQHLRWTEVFPNLRFIHWRRRDVLGQALSRVRAFQTQRWRSTLSSRAEPHYDGEAILDAVHWTVSQDARWELFFARNGIEPLRFVYEDALGAVGATIDAIADLVGLESRPDPVSEITVDVQRDGLTEAWRSRFLAEYADRDTMDRF